MASNLIQIKRSQTTATPTSLANGEMAFTAAGNVVFIGNYGSVLAIAGERTPGILTANQALVANNTGFLNVLKSGNLTITGAMSANGTLGNVGDVLTTDGSGKSYWYPASALAVGPQVVTNTDSRVLSGNLTFSAANTYIANLNVVTINRSPTLTLDGDVSGSATFDNLSNATLNVTITKDFVMDVYAGNGIVSFTGTGAGSAPTISVKPADGIKANTTGLFANVDNSTIVLKNGAIAVNSATLSISSLAGDYVKDVYAGNGISYLVGTGSGSTPTISVLASDGIVSNTTGLFANVDNSTLELSGGAIQVKDDGIALGTKTTGDYVQGVYAANGINVSASSGEGSQPYVGIKLKSGSGLVVDSDGLYLSPSGTQSVENISVAGSATFNGNVTIGSSSADILTINSVIDSSLIPMYTDTYNVGINGAIWKDGYFERIVLGSSSDAPITASGNTINVVGLNVNTSFVANTGTVYHDFYIGGDLHISGNAVYSNVQSYIVNDPLIQLAANNNLTDLYDIGFYGNYGVDGNPANHLHTGLFRDASDGIYKLFYNLTDNPADANYVNTASASFKTAYLQAYLYSGALTSNVTNLNITANNTVAVSITANSINLTTALDSGSGGTGYKTYVNGDLLVGNTSANSLKKLTLGSSGYVLQSDGTNLVYGTLDGGTF